MVGMRKETKTRPERRAYVKKTPSSVSSRLKLVAQLGGCGQPSHGHNVAMQLTVRRRLSMTNEERIPSPSRHAATTELSHPFRLGQHQSQKRQQRRASFIALSALLTLSIASLGQYNLLDSSWLEVATRATRLGQTTFSSPPNSTLEGRPHLSDEPSTSTSLRMPNQLLAEEKNKKISFFPEQKAADGDAAGGTFPLPVMDHTKESLRAVGVVTTLTDCMGVSADGAAVMQYSIIRQQMQKVKSRYQYSFYVIHHPSARECAEPLADLNFTLVEREAPVLPHEIRGEFLRNTIAGNGCCGELELLKFEAFTMTHLDAVVLLDVDTMVLQSLDEAIDLLLDRTVPEDAPSHIMDYPDRPIPDDVWLLYTADYAMVDPDQQLKPVQGGFAIFKPNGTIYEEMKEIVLEGKFEQYYGWGDPDGPHTGWFWGVSTFQGLMPYYFHILNPGHSIEMHNCRYNHMNVEPTTKRKVPGSNQTQDTCWNNREMCEDCRNKKLEEISSIHFTVCTKPWLCEPHFIDDDKTRLCHESLATWYEQRAEMEVSWGRTERPIRAGDGIAARTVGYCSGSGPTAYEAIQLPYRRA